MQKPGRMASLAFNLIGSQDSRARSRYRQGPIQLSVESTMVVDEPDEWLASDKLAVRSPSFDYSPLLTIPQPRRIQPGRPAISRCEPPLPCPSLAQTCGIPSLSFSSRSIASAKVAGFFPGPNLATTLPSRPTRNLVKFQRMAPEPNIPRIPGFSFFRKP
jgi:hypothetical protein